MIDTHAHLNSTKYYPDYLEELAIAKENGVEKIILIGCDLASMDNAINYSKEHAEFCYAIGIHPIDVEEYSLEIVAKIKSLKDDPNLVAIGEIGLDYHWYPEKAEEQKKVFAALIELAQELEVPIIIHSREAYDDCYDILKRYAPLKGVLHSYADDVAGVQRFLDLGLHIGISGPITFKNGHNQKEVAAYVPLEKLLLETDAPFLTPTPYRGKRNKPHYISYVAQEIAVQKNITKQEVIDQTTENAKKLFGLEENV